MGELFEFLIIRFAPIPNNFASAVWAAFVNYILNTFTMSAFAYWIARVIRMGWEAGAG